MTDIAKLGLEVDSRPVDTATGALDRFERSGARAEKSTKRVERATDQLTKSMLTVRGAIASVSAVLATIGASQLFSASMRASREFGKALAEVSTLLEGTAEEMAYLERQSRALSRQYGGTATQQAQAYYQAISAGAGSAVAATRILDTANRLAIGGVSDVTTGVDILTTAMNSYASAGLTASDASDTFFVGVRAGKTTVNELAGSLGNVIPLAASTGVSLQELVGATAALTTQGQSTSTAVTGLRQIIASVIQPTNEATEAAQALGVAFDARALREKGLQQFLQDVINAAGGSQEALGQLFGSVEALNAVLAFTGGAGSQFNTIMAEMEERTGATDAAFQKMAEDMDHRYLVAMAKISDHMLRFGDILLHAAVPALELFADNLDRIAIYAGVAAVVFGGRLAAGIALAAARTFTFSGALVALRGALIRTGIGALIVGLGEIAYRFTQLVEKAGGFGNALVLLSNVASEVWDRIKTGLVGLGMASKGEWKYVQSQAVGAFVGIVSAAETWANTTIGIFVGSGKAIVAAWQAVPAGLEALILAAGEVVGNGVKNMLNAIIDKINDFLRFVNSAIASLPDWVGVSDTQIDLLGDVTWDGLGASAAADRAREAGAGIGDAFAEGLNGTYVSGVSTTLEQTSADLLRTSNTYRTAGNALIRSATLPLQSIQALNEVMSQSEDEALGAADAATEFGQALEEAGTAGELAGNRAAGGANRSRQATRSAIQALRDEIRQRRELLNIAGLDEERLTALRRVEEALAQDRAEWSEARKQQLADELIAVQRLENQMEGMRGLFGSLIDSFASGDISGGLKSFWTDFKRLGTEAWSGILQDAFKVGGGGFKAIWGGLKSAWQGVTSSLAGIGGSLGSIFSGIGGALSAALPIVGAVTGIISLIKGFSTKKLVGAGVGGTLGGDATSAYSYQRIKKSSFWGLFSKTRTYNTAQDELSGQLGLEVANIQDSVTSLIDVMGGAASDISAITHSFKFDTRNMSEEQIQERLQEELEAYGNAIASTALGTDEFTRQGESALEALTRMATGLQAANTAFEALGLHLYDTSLAGADAASALVELFGSLENFTQATDFYYQNFYSEQERLDFTTRKLTETLNDLGFSTVPQTRAQFRMLVEGMREIGDNEGLATLLQIAPAFVGIENAVSSMLESNVTNAENALRDAEQAAKNAYDAAVSAIESERDAVIDHWQAMLDEVADATETASKRASEALRIAGIIFDAQQSALEQAFNAVETHLTALIDTAADAAKETSTVLGLLDRALENRSSTRTEELARSQAFALVQSGDTSDQSRLEQALSTLNEPSDQLFGSYVEYARDYARTTAAISTLRDQTAEQLTAEEQIVATLEAQLDAERSAYQDQVEYLDQQLVAMEAQIDLLNGIDNTLQGAITAIYGSNIDLASAMSDEFGGQARVIEFVEAAIRELADAREEERITQEAADAQIGAAESRAAQQIEALNETVQGILQLDNTILTVTQSIDDLDAAILDLSSAQQALNAAEQQYAEAQLREAQIQSQLTAELLAISQEQERVRQIAALQDQLSEAFTQVGDQPLVLRIVQEVGRGGNWFRDKASYVRLNNGQTFSSKSGGTASELAHARAQAQPIIAASEAAFAAWQSAQANVLEPLRQQIVALGGVPQFADGGFHSGGLRIVGERGAEVEATGPARLYSNKQTREMFRDPDLVQEVARLRKEVSDLRGENRAGQAQIAKNTGRVAALARKQDIEGTPPVREEA